MGKVKKENCLPFQEALIHYVVATSLFITAYIQSNISVQKDRNVHAQV